MKLDLGGGHAPRPGHTNIDLVPEADIVWDLNKGLPGLSVQPNSIDAIFSSHLIEHLDTIIPLMNDAFNTMKTGALFEITTPLAGTTQWYQDPTHKRAYVPESFLYFCENSPFAKEQGEYGITARFKIIKAERGQGVDDWQLFVTLQK